MQEVKLVMRNVGVPNPQENIISSVDFEQYLEYTYLSNGFKVNTTSITQIVGGFTVFMVLIKEEAPASLKGK